MTFLNRLKVYEFSFLSKEKNLSLVFFFFIKRKTEIHGLPRFSSHDIR